MPENDFEKQVQHLFDGFKLKPSDDVWNNVSERIKEDKKDRKLIFWLPVLLLLLGGAGEYLKWGKTNNIITGQGSQSIHSTVPNPSNKSLKEKILKSADENNITGIENEEVNKEKEKNNVALNEKTVGNKNINNGSRSGSLSAPVRTIKSETEAGSQAAVKHVGKERSDVQKPLPVLKNALTAVDNDADNPRANFTKSINPTAFSVKPQKDSEINNSKEDKADNTFAGDITPQNISLHPFMLNLPAGEKTIELLAKNSFPGSSASTPVKLAKKKAWEFGVNTTAGVSKVGNGLSGIFSKFNVVEKSAAMNDALILNNPTAGFVASQNNNYLAALPPSPTPVKPGFGWGAGASAKWYIKSKFALTGAFQYSYYTTRREAGVLISYNYLGFNGINVRQERYAGIYSGINGVHYTNKYHLLELPIGIQWQMNKGIKFVPLQLNAGLSLGWIMNTDALHYDKTTGTYFENKTLFNKAQAGIYTGLSAKLFQHSLTPLYIGPFVQYGFSNLIKPSEGTSQNLMFGGVKAEWILWKK